MPYDHLRTFLGGKAVVELGAYTFILDKALRVYCLSDVVIHCPGAYQENIGFDASGGGVSEVHDLERMLECSRRLLRQYPQQLVVRVAQFLQAGIGNQAENLLHQIDERISGNRKH